MQNWFESDTYYNHPKVQQARVLLNEAYDELMKEQKKDKGLQKCQCGHKRKDHNPSRSVNYTGGSCRKLKCRCLNFILNENN